MKKRRLAEAVLILALVLTIPAFADMIDVPDNDFWMEHQEEMEYCHRWYTINSPRGYVNFREAPGGRVVHQEKNGPLVMGEDRYQGWLFVSYIDNGGLDYVVGWVKEEELSPRYDSLSFYEEYGETFVPCGAETVAAYLLARESSYVVYWEYPNAETAVYAEEKTEEDFAEMSSRISVTYTDPEGYLWGQDARTDLWICLSALDAGEGQEGTLKLYHSNGTPTPYKAPRVVSVREIPETDLYPAREPVPPWVFPTALVALVTLLSAAALWLLYGRRYRRQLMALSLVLLLLPLLTALISSGGNREPGNRFFQRHQEDCEEHRERYTINSPRGYLSFRTAPYGSVIHQEQNGAKLTVRYRYRNWGFVKMFLTDNGLIEGWVPMSELAQFYDGAAFKEEHKGEILPAQASVTEPLLNAYLQSGRTALVIWPYPNAPEATYYYEEAPRSLEKLRREGFTSTFTDEEGYLWGWGGYWENFWVLLSDPGAGDGVYVPEDGKESNIGERIVPVRDVPAITRYPAKEPPPPWLFPAALLTLVTLLSAGALWFFFGRRRGRRRET